jgi:hypothetical protein
MLGLMHLIVLGSAWPALITGIAVQRHKAATHSDTELERLIVDLVMSFIESSYRMTIVHNAHRY